MCLSHTADTWFAVKHNTTKTQIYYLNQSIRNIELVLLIQQLFLGMFFQSESVVQAWAWS